LVPVVNRNSVGVGEAMFGASGLEGVALLGEGDFAGGGGGLVPSSRLAGLSCLFVASDGDNNLEDRRAGQGEEMSGRS